MEADSTTYDGSPKENPDVLPFPACPRNFSLYKDLTNKNSTRHLESQIVERLQDFGLIPKLVKCPSGKPGCKVISRNARVIDRIQWVCEGCGKRQPIRTRSFFYGVQCSLLQALQMILAWCEDADCESAAQNFGVKPKVAYAMYDKLDELAVKEQSKHLLGGNDSVVMAEMYPDCLTRLSPDTTDQPHVHKILMLADSNHIPTNYQLHVIRDELKKNTSRSLDNQSLKAEIDEAVSRLTVPNSMLVRGTNVPPVEGAITVQAIEQYGDADMQHFLTSRIWRQALTVCAASHDLCSGAASVVCAGAVQRYLTVSLYRLRHDDDFFRHTLNCLSVEYTDNTGEACGELL